MDSKRSALNISRIKPSLRPTHMLRTSFDNVYVPRYQGSHFLSSLMTTCSMEYFGLGNLPSRAKLVIIYFGVPSTCPKLPVAPDKLLVYTLSLPHRVSYSFTRKSSLTTVSKGPHAHSQLSLLVGYFQPLQPKESTKPVQSPDNRESVARNLHPYSAN